jgi:integrase
MARAGITERTTVHDLRRTYISSLLESGAPMPHVMALAGHKSMETTLRHYAVSRSEKVIESWKAGMDQRKAEVAAAAAAQAGADAKGAA